MLLNILPEGDAYYIFSNNIAVPSKVIDEPHATYIYGSCSLTYKHYPLNRWYFQGMNRKVTVTKQCYNGAAQPHEVSVIPMKQFCSITPDPKVCSALNFEPYLIKEGDLAASAAKLQPDQYGNADKMVFDKDISTNRSQQLLQAIISYRRGSNNTTRQLKTLYLEVSNKHGIRHVSDRLVWYPGN